MEKDIPPYGHACTNCAKAKCKCVSRAGPGGGKPPGPDSKCDRCYRLGRECTPSATVRKRGTARRTAARSLGGAAGGTGGSGNGSPGGETTTARTAQLEEKLDDLVSLLRSQHAAASAAAAAAAAAATAAATPTATDVGADSGTTTGPGTSNSSGPTPHQIPTPESSAAGDENVVSRPQARLRSGDMAPRGGGGGGGGGKNPFHIAASSCFQLPPGTPAPHIPELEPAKAEECLQFFRDNHLRFFPFVYISPETTAEELQKKRPFLWLNIRTLTCKSSVQQAALGHRIREIIGQQVLGQSDRTMDLLLGLLGFLGWGMVQAMGRPMMAVFTGIATGIISDLRLDKPSHFNPLKEAHAFKPYRFTCQVPWTSSDRTHEHRRAVLACYIISANNFYFLKTQIMRWTPYMEDSLEKLWNEPEWPGDQVLATLVRIFKVLEDFSHVQWNVSDFGGRPGAPKATAMYYVKGLRANLEEIRRNLPDTLKENKIVQTYLYSAEAQINDLPMQSPTPSATPGFIDFGRTECFDLCLRAIKLCLENYFSFEAAEYIGFSMPMFLHYARATQILYRLSLSDDPAWDRASIRHTVDLIGVLVLGEERFASVARAVGLESDGPDGGDMFTKGAQALRATIPIWRASLEHVGAIPPSSNTAAATNAITASAGAVGGGDTMSGGASNTVATATSTTEDMVGPSAVDVTMGDAGVGGVGSGAVVGDLNSAAELPSSLDVMQDFMWADFTEDPWISDFFTWQSPMR
ncbi:hypothetical protein SLS62_002985 [Diatrype stigma]|uniref:Zn(2)-C6 fungal-type domain-containing protein n=1 Tax=Diatrype stigma TaxID=117547 RepID=A0AAN9UZI2_9PEZI